MIFANAPLLNFMPSTMLGKSENYKWSEIPGSGFAWCVCAVFNLIVRNNFTHMM